MVKDDLSQELSARVKQIIKKDPSIMLSNIADQLSISEAAVACALPESMRSFADPSSFDGIWEAMTGWERITFICQTRSAVVEIKGKLPRGKYGHGYFNLMEKNNPLGGHLQTDALGWICFLEKPFFGLESLSVQFYDKEGAHMFAVYAGREKRELIPLGKDSLPCP